MPEAEGHAAATIKNRARCGLVRVMAPRPLPTASSSSAPPAVDYLKKRGLSGEIAARFGIGYAPDGWQNLQAVFPTQRRSPAPGRPGHRQRQRPALRPLPGPADDPHRQSQGRHHAFGGRIIDQGEPKYLNSPETPLFEKAASSSACPRPATPCAKPTRPSSPKATWTSSPWLQNGVGNAVATLGTATTATHVQKLLRQVDRVVFASTATTPARGRLARPRKLPRSPGRQQAPGFVFLPAEDDPDSFIRSRAQGGFDRLVRQAMPPSDFLLRELARRCDLTSSEEGKAQLIYEAKPLLHKLPTPLLRLQLVNGWPRPAASPRAKSSASANSSPHAPPAPPGVPVAALRPRCRATCCA